MCCDQETLADKLLQWKQTMEGFQLPMWEELPDVDLYMDQVVVLVCRYLSLIPHDENNPIVTSSAINNYVRLKLLPAPVRKRYSRRHLATVLMICTLKQSLSLAEIQPILPPELDDDTARRMYNGFSTELTAGCRSFVQKLDTGVPDTGATELAFHSAVNSLLFRLLTIQLVRLHRQEPEEA